MCWSCLKFVLSLDHMKHFSAGNLAREAGQMGKAIHFSRCSGSNMEDKRKSESQK